ncbi:MAG: phosphotransferase [bacterium]
MTDYDVSRHFPRDQFGAITAVTPFSQGMSGAAVYGVTTDSGEFVLRLVSPKVADRWRGRLAIQQLASAHGVTPPIVTVEDDGRAIVSARVNGLPFAAALGDAATRPRVIGSLVEIFARLHSLPTDGLPVSDPLDVVRSLWNVQSGRPGFPSWALPLGESLPRIERLLESDPRRAVSHNDPNPGNILWDGTRVWLIDWDASGVNHPYYDLAGVAMFLSMPDEAALGLLAAQERGPIGAEQAELFRALRTLVTMLFATTFLEMVADLAALPDEVIETTLTPSECFRGVGSGAMDLRDANVRGMIGAALLRLLVGHRA